MQNNVQCAPLNDNIDTKWCNLKEYKRTGSKDPLKKGEYLTGKRVECMR